MKKLLVLLVLILLNITVYFGRLEQTFLEKIDLNLDEGEYLVLFFPDMLFIGTQKEDYLIPLEDEIKLEQLKDFNIKKIDYLISSKDYDVPYKKKVNFNNPLVFENLQIKKDDNLKLKIYDQTICVLESEDDECEHVFLKSDQIEIQDSMKTLFFEEKYVNSIKPKLFKKWIDAYTLLEDCYTFLKVTEKGYEVVVIPQKNE